MKFIPFGILKNTEVKPLMEVIDYDDKLYDAVELRKDKRKRPVVIMHSKREDPLTWKVVYGFSEVYFRTFADAVAFCNSRGFQLVKERT